MYEEHKKVQKILDKERHVDPNLIGTAIGYKKTNGETTDKLCVFVYVVKKLGKDYLPESKLIPPIINDIPTDVIELGGYPEPMVVSRTGQMMRNAGCIKIGTHGGVVQDPAGTKFILTNAHVLALSENQLPPLKGVRDFLCSAEIGRMHDIMQRSTNPSAPAFIDAGIVRITGSVSSWNSCYGNYNVNAVVVSLGASVKRASAVTGCTTGIVDAENGSFTDSLGFEFAGMVGMTNASLNGDSGSLTVTETGLNPTVLLSHGGILSWGGRIQEALGHWGLSFVNI